MDLPLEFNKIWVDVPYIAAAALFIASIIGLSKQETAKLGNVFGVLGMLTCVISLYIYECIKSNKLDSWSTLLTDLEGWGNTTEKGWYIIPIFLVVGCLVGVGIGASVEMTAMPIMVGILNALGGFAATLEGIAFYVSKYSDFYATTPSESRLQMFFVLLSIVIGLITFVGSILAAYKVGANVKPNIPAVVNVIILIIIIALMIFTGLGGYPVIPKKFTFDYIKVVTPFDKPESQWTCFALLLFFSIIYGVTFVLPIGGADMPVVIALLNAFSGMSGCFAGFLAENKVLIITGAIVASSGCILSYIMCKAMNRSLMSVIIGSGTKKAVSTARETNDGHPIKAEELYNILSNIKSVMIIPGYGMAYGKAQGEVATLVNHLMKAGKDVRFGIHPVAGRLPGHMNVLLAEARVPYDIVFSMDEINNDMKNVDLCFVIGANDTVNPDAVNNPDCDIYGMPVIRAWDAKTVVILKRKLEGAGYSEVFNPLPFMNNSRFYGGDSKQTISQLNQLISNKLSEFCSGAGAVSKKIDLAKNVPKNYSAMTTYKKIGVPRESGIFQETRVALSPDICGVLREKGFEIFVETKAGVLCNFSNRMYKEYGCHVCTKEEVFANADIIVKINELTDKEVLLLRPSQVVISYSPPGNKKDLLSSVSSTGVSWIGMDKVPRITTAQKFDSLSSAGKISGYRSVIEGLYYYQGFISQQITAAGKYPQAKVFILGAGVAGLEAIGIFKMLGAEVYCFDVRPETKEQIESMGGTHVELQLDGSGQGGYAKELTPAEIEKEQLLIQETAMNCDIVICTAAIPNRRAPLLLTRRAVEAMKPGSVVVDISSRTGGNCEVTRNGGVYVSSNGVTIVGHLNMPGLMPKISSEMYAGNIVQLLGEMGNAEKFKIDLGNPVIACMLLTHNSDVTVGKYPPPAPPKPKPKAPVTPLAKPEESSGNCGIIFTFIMLILCVVLLVLVALYFPVKYFEYLMVFMLSCFVGYLSVWGVSPSLHTPLMSVTNAISGVVILGAIPLIHEPEKSAPLWLGMVAIFFSAVNIGGGFYVTQRMLNMFVSKKEVKPAATTTTTTTTNKPTQPTQPSNAKPATTTTTTTVPSTTNTNQPSSQPRPPVQVLQPQVNVVTVPSVGPVPPQQPSQPQPVVNTNTSTNTNQPIPVSVPPAPAVNNTPTPQTVNQVAPRAPQPVNATKPRGTTGPTIARAGTTATARPRGRATTVRPATGRPAAK